MFRILLSICLVFMSIYNIESDGSFFVSLFLLGLALFPFKSSFKNSGIF